MSRAVDDAICAYCLPCPDISPAGSSFSTRACKPGKPTEVEIVDDGANGGAAPKVGEGACEEMADAPVQAALDKNDVIVAGEVNWGVASPDSCATISDGRLDILFAMLLEAESLLANSVLVEVGEDEAEP